jgi:hypothetical protein
LVLVVDEFQLCGSNFQANKIILAERAAFLQWKCVYPPTSKTTASLGRPCGRIEHNQPAPAGRK